MSKKDMDLSVQESSQLQADLARASQEGLGQLAYWMGKTASSAVSGVFNLTGDIYSGGETLSVVSPFRVSLDRESVSPTIANMPVWNMADRGRA